MTEADLWKMEKSQGVKTYSGAVYHCKGSCTLHRNISESEMYLRRCQQLYRTKWTAGGQLSDGLSESAVWRCSVSRPEHRHVSINGRSIFRRWKSRKGMRELFRFRFSTDPESVQIDQVSCWLTYTNEKHMRSSVENLDRSPLYSGMIEGTGPRYCPSIEDKVVRFADKTDIRYLSNRKD